MEIVAADLGGTHARFSIATLSDGGAIQLGELITLKTAEHATFEDAWERFAASHGGDLPRAVAIAVACPVSGGPIKMTNNPWVIRPDGLEAALDIDAITLVNDFGAVGRAVARMDRSAFTHMTGPDRPLPEDGVISVIGPGTGLGVAMVVRRKGAPQVIETEGGHSDFAPLDAVEDGILTRLRPRFRRVSVERIVSGPGLLNIYQALCAIEDKPASIHDDKALWAAALGGQDPLAITALERFLMTLGSVMGDIALTQGAAAVVIAGGVGARIAPRLASSGFADRFTAKGRFETLMKNTPVKLLADPKAGLIGAAAAFVEEHPQ